MLQRFRIPLVILIVLSICFAAAGPISAKTDEPELINLESDRGITGFKILPLMLYINQISTTISIDTYGQTSVTGCLYGNPGVTDEVWIYLYLERYENGSWLTFNNWSETYSNYYGFLQESDVVPHGYYYRVKGSYYAWSGNNYEHEYNYSRTIYY